MEARKQFTVFVLALGIVQNCIIPLPMSVCHVGVSCCSSALSESIISQLFPSETQKEEICLSNHLFCLIESKNLNETEHYFVLILSICIRLYLIHELIYYLNFER